jgi:GNAT superfamily N-acetyltransferase
MNMATRKKSDRNTPTSKKTERPLVFHPLTPERWADFETLFGPQGACGGCWCMWWRLTHREFERNKGEPNRRAMKKLVGSGQIPGILAYQRGRPVGWCSVGPRKSFPRLERSRLLKRVDDQPVWSVVCFFVARSHRRQGLATRLLEAAVEYAERNGARIVEGYPVEPKRDRAPDLFLYHGPASSFRRTGFREVARRSDTRHIMRQTIRT